ncbi:hypothetical protein BDY17DRAFT_299258 [Neohortaea acidophila]|uniref:Uncharacterized protein n=1 Tax=Neohortaea acidophila TaxID=245834 RepID=A0A6A6PUE8_9PEZI|nr:uncharacterized protein BDY17DRAFT_299258 [Neohortaea acidophila]KAF2482847.1 hypothetical protein BDY17DRAFT_299258 [Neohortaea acidophila]
MSPTVQLRSQIFYHLDFDLLETANFLAGRLHALEPRNPDSSHLLALTYLRLRRFKAAYDYSHRYGANGRHLGCAYVFAQACLQLGGGRVVEGANALEKSRPQWTGKNHFNKCSDTHRRCLPDAAACWTVLGQLWRAHGDAKKAGDCFVEAHRCNAFVWEAFQGLCKVGADLKVHKMFQPSSDMVSASAMDKEEELKAETQEIARPLSTQLNFNQQVFTPSADPLSTTPKIFGDLAPDVKHRNAPVKSTRPFPTTWDTPVGESTVLDEDIAMSGVVLDDAEITAPPAPARRPRTGQQFDQTIRPPTRVRGQSSERTSESSQAHIQPPRPGIGGHKRTVSGQQPAVDPAAASSQPRRSNRLFGQHSSTRSGSSTSRSTAFDSTAASLAGRVNSTAPERPAKPATGAKGRIGSTVGRVVSGNRKMLPPDRNEKDTKRAPSRNSDKSVPTITASTNQLADQQIQKLPPSQPKQPSEPSPASYESLIAILDPLRDLALGVYSTTRFDTSLAIRTLRALPSAQRDTPAVLAQLGKAHYEGADYKSAEECFARVLKLQPSRVEDMDVYSTVLWHLKRETALTFLCHHLSETDHAAPERWVAVGNAFSLSREHDQAIAAFKRATQVDDTFAYAWTLMGHEYIANEEFDAALSSFRKAVSIDRRGYGGWYGLGKSYERMGKLEESERHYRIAASINPSNSTLLVCIGVVLEKLRNKKAALANYTRALDLAPQSALARFKKARVLMHLRHWQEALVELEILRDQAPDEANVWFLLGKCYKGLGERGEALRALTTALNLDVKAAPFIKEAMEALDEDEEMESDED